MRSKDTKGVRAKQALESGAILDPRVYKDNLIDPMLIYGVGEYINGEAPQIRDHPEFSNPRSLRNMDQGIIEDIAQTGELLEPVKLYLERGRADRPSGRQDASHGDRALPAYA